MDVTLTTSEAGYVLERSQYSINKAVDTGLIRVDLRPAPRGRGTIRVLGRPELRFLKLADVLENDITAIGQRRIYEALRLLPDRRHQIQLGILTLELSALDRAIELRLERLTWLRSQVETPAGGEPVIRGTSIPVYMVSGLAKGETIDEILEDYPSLNRPKVEIAIEYALAYPKKGRPYPTRSVKRALAGLGLEDIEIERTSDGPRLIPL